MSDRRMIANRANASKSTGPQTAEGKTVASRNALRHGLRSSQLLLDGEDPLEFAELHADLMQALAPVGAVELSLAERIVIAIWRQRRLALAEAAALTLERRDGALLDGLRRLHDWCEREEITATCLEPFDAESVAWCRTVLDEVKSLSDYTLEELEEAAPHVWGQLKDEADEDKETPEAYLSGSENGLAEFLADLCKWCRRQLEAAKKRPQLLEFVEQLRKRGLVLPAVQLDVMARYQTTLDNQLYKALRAYREAQEWRLKTLEPVDDEQRTASAIDAAA